VPTSLQNFAMTTITLLGGAVGLRAPISFANGYCEPTRRC
jgi:hypothetical protein